MKFGRVANVNAIDFSLPLKNEKNARVLYQFRKENSEMRIYIGCPAWGNKDWKDKIYPPKAKANQFLTYYAKQFNCVELNTSHYSIQEQETVQKWCDMVGEAFKFCPKFHKAISHTNKLVNCDAWLERFYAMATAFGKNLGLCFLQLAPSFAPDEIEALERVLANKPPEIEIAVEFRNEEWFTDKSLFAETVQLLSENNATALITDTAGRRDVLHMRLSTPKTFIRFVGNNLHPSDFVRIDHWVNRIKFWRDGGLQELYFFIHEPDEFYCPELARYFIKKLNEVLNINHPNVEIVERPVQGTLF